MDNNERFIEIGKRKEIIKQLQSEVDAYEKENKLTFKDDVRKFFLDKGYEFNSDDRYKNEFINLRQVDDKSTFRRTLPCYYIAGKNDLIIRFEWWLLKNGNRSTVYWYPEKKTLENFYEKSLKKVLILPLSVERRDKLKKLRSL
jgi:hypothetical protein